MTISTAFSFVPLVGESNIPLVADSTLTPPEDAVLRPSLLGNGDFISKNSFGDGGPPTDDPSLIVTDPAGRPGSLRTTLLIQVLESQDAGLPAKNGIAFNVSINIPPGMQGTVPGGLTEAQINDPARFPIIDPSQFIPRIQGYGYRGPWAPDADLGPAQSFPFDMSQFTLDFPPGISFTGTVLTYIPPQSYETFTGGVAFEAGAYGVLELEMLLQGSSDGSDVTLDVGTNIVIDIDFSHSITN